MIIDKILIALKCEDGWLCNITETHIMKNPHEVYQLCAEKNLEVKEQFCTEGRIYAELPGATCRETRDHLYILDDEESPDCKLTDEEQEFADLVEPTDTSEMIDSGELKEVKDHD